MPEIYIVRDEKLHSDGGKNVEIFSVVFTLVLNHALHAANE
jgi:hypothetical protein